MKRISIKPRANWQSALDSIGFKFHSVDGCYWRDDLAYEFALAEIEFIENAANELHEMYLSTLNDLIFEGQLDRLFYSDSAQALIESSFYKKESSLYGRFDFSYHGINNLKLLEYNADTPTSLLESSLAQWFWLNDVFPGHDQFNGIHEALLNRFKEFYTKASLILSRPVFHFAGIYDSEEDAATLDYLFEIATQAGFECRWLHMNDIGFNGQHFVDLDDNKINFLFKLYPWEWMMEEPFFPYIHNASVKILEPAWKMVLSNKGMMALLFEKYPNHPYLLPTYFEPHTNLGRNYVKKPFYSREGTNIVLNIDGQVYRTEEEENPGGIIYQATHLLPQFENIWTHLGCWISGNQACGLAIREDNTPITKDTSHFVPHYIA